MEDIKIQENKAIISIDTYNDLCKYKYLYEDSLKTCQHPFNKIVSGDNGLYCIKCSKKVSNTTIID